MNTPATKKMANPYTGVAVAGLVVIAAGALLWARFGPLVYFDTIAAAFVGCLI